MTAEELEKWYQSNPRKSTVVYYWYERKDGKLLARACERNPDVGALAGLAWKYAREGKAVIYQRFSKDTCEYILKKI